METPKAEKAWRCPDCGWTEAAHPAYGWQRHNERAVAVHQTTLCPRIRADEEQL